MRQIYDRFMKNITTINGKLLFYYSGYFPFHESRLNIESTLGKGTRFSFVIPERLIAKKSA